jgi:hypothetical protein
VTRSGTPVRKDRLDGQSKNCKTIDIHQNVGAGQLLEIYDRQASCDWRKFPIIILLNLTKARKTIQYTIKFIREAIIKSHMNGPLHVQKLEQSKTSQRIEFQASEYMRVVARTNRPRESVLEYTYMRRRSMRLG